MHSEAPSKDKRETMQVEKGRLTYNFAKSGGVCAPCGPRFLRPWFHSHLVLREPAFKSWVRYGDFPNSELLKVCKSLEDICPVIFDTGLTLSY